MHGSRQLREKKEVREWRLTWEFYRAGLKEHKIAVVCSARSTGKKVEGTTSR